MPFATPYPQPAVKAAILARVAAGETVKDICRGDPALPTPESISIWSRQDPAFREAMAAARRRVDWMRRFAFDEAVAAAFLARVAAGERVKAVVGQPGMPGQATYRYWRRTQVGFQEGLWRLRGFRYARLAEQHRARPRWGAFDPAVADRILVRVARGEGWARILETDRSLPHRQAAMLWRAAEPEWDRALKIAFRFGRRTAAAARSRARAAELTEAITSKIVTGASLCGLGREPEMPCAATLLRWFHRWPDFAREIDEACEFRDWWFDDQILAIGERHGPLGLAAARREAAPLERRMNGLAKRPGWKRRRDAAPMWGDHS
ncbi:hypothetical protein [Phenylobacterium sp.]|uniref:terminase small subunit-like protein n=1 Tax=Phenylobacterium sp. TaxID=1871053 RepID=UPI003563ADAC